MKRFLLLFILLLMPFKAHSESFFAPIIKRSHLGLEWGLAQNMYKHHHYNIFSEEGYRINEVLSSSYIRTNAHILLVLDFELNNKFSIAFLSGLEGIYENSSIIPLKLRLKYYYKGYHNDGFFSYIDGAVGWKSHDRAMHNTLSSLASIGGGYRVELAQRCRLDFLLSLRGSHTHPLIPSPDGVGYTAESNIRANNAEFLALCLGLSLSF